MARARRAVLASIVTLSVVSACSSSKSVTGQPSGHTITVGLLTDMTGPAASASKSSPQGVAAGAVIAAKAGYRLKYVIGDTGTSPAGALTAAQKLVDQDHVQAIIAISAVTFGATSYLTSKGIPVVGFGDDGPEWLTAKNMFSTMGFVDTSKVSTTIGIFMKKSGVTTVGAIGYGISPSSSEAAQAGALSAQRAGLRVGYLNAKLPFGSTNVQPVALAMKSAGVDGVTADVDPNTNLALLTALRQLGDNPKVSLFPTGYGADLFQSGPGAVRDAQGAYFTLAFEPVEMHTAATQQLVGALRAVGVSGDPTFSEYGGYTSVALLLDALKSTGPQPTNSSLIAALTKVHSFDAAGLLGTHPFDMSARGATAVGPGACSYITRLSGSSFQLVPGADPICGNEIAGLAVTVG